MEIVDRIVHLAKAKCRSIRAFEISINKKGGYLNTMLKRGSVPGADVIRLIKEVYPDVNVNWLLAGEGDMLLNEVGEPTATYNISVTVSDKDDNSELFQALEALLKRSKQ